MKKFMKYTVFFTGANIGAFIFSSLTSFVLAKILEPSEFGGYSAIKLFISYALAAQLGVVQGLQREIPFSLAKNDMKKYKRILHTAFSVVVITSIFPSLIFLIAAFNVKGFFKEALILIFLFVPFMNIKEYYSFVFKGLERFGELSFLRILESILIMVLGITLGFFYKGKGAILGFVLAGSFYFLISVKLTKLFFLSIKVYKQELKELLKAGTPIFIIGTLNLLIFSIDRLTILSFWGRTHYGFYSIAQSFLILIYQLPIAFSTVVLPFLTKKKARGYSISDYFVERRILLFLSALCFSVFIFVLYPLIELFIETFFSNYIESLKPLKIFLSLIIFPIFHYFFYSFLIAENKHIYLLPYYIFLLPITFILNIVLVPVMGLKGGALSFMLSYCLMSFFIVLKTSQVIKKSSMDILFPVIIPSILHFIVFSKVFHVF
jgi:O-antigen/teichoic acid export membrane protein